MEFNHVALGVNNLEESIEFYEKYFGFSVDKKYEKSTGCRFCFMKTQNFRIELFEFGDRKPSVDDQKDLRIVGLRHLAFKVDNVKKTVDRLQESGLDFGPIEDGTSCKYYTFTTDPSGISIELYEAN